MSVLVVLIWLAQAPPADSHSPFEAASVFAPVSADAVSQTVAIWIDDFAPQPQPGQTFWPHNRLGGDRGRIDGPGSGTVVWGQGRVTATITSGTNTYFGVWTSLHHPIRDHTPLDFSAIFPAEVQPPFQGRVTDLQVQVLDGAGAFQVELRAQNPTVPGQEIVKWSGSATLNGVPQLLQFSLPITLGDVQNLNWLVTGSAGIAWSSMT